MTYRCGWCWGVAERPRIDPGVAYHTDQDVIKSHTLWALEFSISPGKQCAPGSSVGPEIAGLERG